MPGMITRFRRDTRGNTAILAAFSIFTLVGFGAIAVDVSNLFYLRRKQQSVGDLAAIAAASDVANARKAVLAALASNEYDASVLAGIDYGTYTADPTKTVPDRFVIGPTGAGNAVRVRLSADAPLYLARIFAPRPASAASGDSSTGSSSVSIGTVSIAAQDNAASFAIGSRLLKLDGGIINGVLGSLLGTNVSLSVLDYTALLNLKVDLLTFSRALATRLSLTGVTYDQLLSTQVRTGDALAALVDVARGSGATAATVTALQSLAIAKAASLDKVDLSQLLSPGPYGSLGVQTTAPVSVALNALDLVSALAQISNGTRQVQTALSVSLPGIASVSLQLAIGERPIGTSLVSIGRAGATVHTAQTRLLLNVSLIGSPPAAAVALPVYVEVASGTARLSRIACTPGDVASTSVTLGVTPAVVDAWIGAVSQADFTNTKTKPNPGPATFLNLLGLATVTGRAHATMTNLSETPATFSYADVQALTKKTVSTTDFTSSLFSRLLGDLQLKVNVIGLPIGVPAGLDTAVGQVLATATAPVDQLLAGVLGTLGVGLGQADTWVSGVRCGSAVLVN